MKGVWICRACCLPRLTEDGFGSFYCSRCAACSWLSITPTLPSIKRFDHYMCRAEAVVTAIINEMIKDASRG